VKPFSILLLVGALFIAIGVLTPHWFSFGFDENSYHSGLYSMVSCHGEEGCETELIFKFLGHGGGMGNTIGMLLGIVILLGGLGTAVINAISGFATMNRRGPAYVSMLMSAILGGVAILHLAIGHGITHPGSWGYSLFLFFFGVIVSVAGGIMAMGAYPAAPRPMMYGYGMQGGMMPGMPGMPMVPQQQYQQQMMIQQQYAQQQQMMQQQQQMQPPPQQQQQYSQQPNCNQCGGPTVWNGQVGKLFCQPCNRFLV
jgi:hypothetical protein